MSDLKIAVIVGSTRPGRVGKSVADWVIEQSLNREASYDLIDLEVINLPFFDEEIPPAAHRYQKEHTKRWADIVAQYDGYILVTPEYNHSTSAVLKNALDFVYAEWNNKAVGFVSYGSASGVRAVEHLRAIVGQLQLADVAPTLGFSLFTDFKNMKEFVPADMHIAEAQTLFNAVEAWAGALKPLRAN